MAGMGGAGQERAYLHVCHASWPCRFLRLRHEFSGMLKSTCNYHRPSVAIVVFVLPWSGGVLFETICCILGSW